MGITQIIDPFYQELEESSFRSEFTSGQIGWVPVPFTWGIPKIVNLHRASPQDHVGATFTLEQMNEKKHFKKQSRLPIKLLGLRETEELLINKCKLRPAIVLIPDQTNHSDLSNSLRMHGKSYMENTLVGVIPLYSVEKEDTETGFPAVFLSRVKALMYNQFFYCPRKGSSLRGDSIAKLDSMFFMRPLRPTFNPTQDCLSDQALEALKNLLALLFGLNIPKETYQDFEALRTLALETLPDEALPDS